MRIRDVDIPDGLLDAQQSGSLVVFAGAGVSVPPPSNYPDFKKLAHDVAHGVLVRPETEPVDRFLGHLKKRDIPVHQIVQRILSDPKSSPNPLHSNLLRIFQSRARVKLVTTNFDHHFTTAAKSLFGDAPDLEIYFAPALPPGDAFTGLVYLHGSVDKPAERLVLTDADFGRGYLTEGWARRFLQRLFSTKTVLFVGYSHSDPVMNYLARGLPPDSGAPKRFALTLERDRDNWEFLGITPVVYPRGDGEHEHAAVGSLIAAWASRIEMGVLDQEEHIRKIVLAKPAQMDSEQSDYILNALREASTARFFTRYARDTEWLRWVEAQGLLGPLFRSDRTSEADKELASWFAEQFAIEHHGDALAVVQRQGEFLNEVLWISTAFHLFRRTAPQSDPKIIAKWASLLINCVPRGGTREVFDFILAKVPYPEGETATILLFQYLTSPRISLKKDLWGEITNAGSQDVRVELAAEGNDYWLTEAWHKLFRPRLGTFAERLVWVVTSNLERANLLLECFGRITPGWDPLSFSRDAVESTGMVREFTDVLVDAAVAIVDLYAATKPNKLDALIEMWTMSRCQLLKRLAIYAVLKATHWDSDRKLHWILENGFLYQASLRRDVFSVLKEAYPGASEALRAALLAGVTKGPLPDTEPNRKAQEMYNLLRWLHEAAPNCPLATEQLEIVLTNYPQFRSREHPDLENIQIAETGSTEQSPLTVAELIAKTPQEQIGFLLSYNPEYSPNCLTRTNLLHAVASAITKAYAWGIALAEILESRALWQSDMWPSIVDGWKARDLADAEWGEILRFLVKNARHLSVAKYQMATLLQNGAQKPEHSIPIDQLLLSFKASREVWEAITMFPEDRQDKAADWLMVAINHAAGILAEFWLKFISRFWAHQGEKWTGLPAEAKGLFDGIISAQSYGSELVRIVFASNLHFLVSADKAWGLERIVPLLDLTKDTRGALQCWHGYLVWGRWLAVLLRDLLPLYEKALPAILKESDELQGRFSEHIAEIACLGSINPLQEGWLNRFIDAASPELRRRWASHVQRVLKHVDEPKKKEIWNSWVEQYWDNRILGIPLPLDGVEAGEMAEWSLHLEPVFPEVVKKIFASPAPQLERSFIYYELPDTKLSEQYPSEAAQLILFLLRKSTAPIYDFDRIDRIFEQFISGRVRRVLLLEICDELARLGYAGASRLRKLTPGTDGA